MLKLRSFTTGCALLPALLLLSLPGCQPGTAGAPSDQPAADDGGHVQPAADGAAVPDGQGSQGGPCGRRGLPCCQPQPCTPGLVCSAGRCRCPAGGCQVQTIASGLNGPLKIVAASGAVMWTNSGDCKQTKMNGSVMKLAAGGKASTLAGGQRCPHGLAVHKGQVFWAGTGASGWFNDGQVVRAPIGGGAPVILTSGGEHYSASYAGIVVTDAAVFLTNTGDGYLQNGTILRLGHGGGKPVVLAKDQGDPSELALLKGQLYWSSNGAATGKVMRVPVSGGSPQVVFNGGSNINGVVSDGAAVYWTVRGLTDSSGKIMRQVPGSQPVTLAAAQDHPLQLAVDGDHVYWTNFGAVGKQGAVMRAPVKGGQAAVIAAGQPRPLGVAVDQRHVYWVTTSPATVRRVPR